ncbi:MAG: DUF6057 family protein [Bacteroidales bacterium]
MKAERKYIFHVLPLLLFIALAFFINACKLWDIQQIVFYTDSQFWREHSHIIGGISEWITNLICQFFFYPIVGNVLLGVILFALFELIMLTLNRLASNKFNYILALILPCIFLYFLKNPIFPLNFIFQLIITLLLVNVFLHFYPSNPVVNFLLFILLFLSIFYINSFLSTLVFGFCVLAFDFKSKRKNIAFRIIILIVLSALVFLIGKYILLTPNQIIFTGKEIFVFQSINFKRIWLVFLIIPFLALLAGLLRKQVGPLSPIIGIVAITLLVAGVILIPLKDKNILADTFRYLDHNKSWEKLLKKAEQLRSDDRIVNFYTNKALYYTGKLSTHLFEYPQSWGEYALFLTTLTEPTTLMDNSDLFYELGHIGAARYWAFEAQTVFENRPNVIKRLAECNIILGNYHAAKSFALKLSKSIIHKKVANYYLRLINDTTLIAHDKTILLKRQYTPKALVFLTKSNPENELKWLVETCPSNRMAYEYLQTFYLLHNDVNKFAQNICNLTKIGFNFLPNIYEQGIITLYYMKNVKADTICEYKISEATRYRFEGYIRMLNQFGGNFSSAEPILRETFGNTYWYYLHFVSPITLKTKIEIQYE